MIAHIAPALRMLGVLTILTGMLYPLAVTAVAQILFPLEANGSLVTQGETVVGSALIGQNVSDARYFWGRPSATAYDALPSGASNAGLTNATWQKLVDERARQFRAANGLAANAPVPPDMLYASGSGLDPDISPDAARMQVARVAEARAFSNAKRAMLAALVERSIEPPALGVLGQARVNVLRLNVALDQLREAP